MVHQSATFAAQADPATLDRAAQLLGADGPRLAHAFDPHGLSLAAFGGSCHVVLHTWPEHNAVTVDVYASQPIDLSVLVTALHWQPVAGDGMVREPTEEPLS